MQMYIYHTSTEPWVILLQWRHLWVLRVTAVKGSYCALVDSAVGTHIHFHLELIIFQNLLNGLISPTIQGNFAHFDEWLRIYITGVDYETKRIEKFSQGVASNLCIVLLV